MIRLQFAVGVPLLFLFACSGPRTQGQGTVDTTLVFIAEPGSMQSFPQVADSTRMLKDGSLPRPNANTICVVFLAPELHSTLGTMIAGKHYVAYHSFFNSMGTRLHYAVVPFEADPKSAYQIALRVFASAALNPNGTASK